jgi:hypothetical protein
MAKAIRWNIFEIQKPVYKGSYLDLELFVLDQKLNSTSLPSPFNVLSMIRMFGSLTIKKQFA